MVTPKQFLLSSFSGLILLFLIYSSYINQKNTSAFIEPQIQNNLSQEYFLQEDIQVYLLDHADVIIQYDSDIQVDDKNIQLNKGNFLVDIGSINTKYTFEGNGFRIKNNGPTSFYIDNSKSKTYIYALNSIVEIELQDPTTQEKVNTIYLYPNEYIGFSPGINRIIKGADLLRVSQVFSLNYINENIFKNGTINPNWKQKILFGEEIKIKKLEEMFSFLLVNREKNTKILEDFITNKKASISGENFIERYFEIFLNTEKKKIYYKNIIIRELATILSDNNAKISNALYLESNLSNLKKIDTSGYEATKDIILYYLSLGEKLETLPHKKVVLAKIKAKILQETFIFTREDILMLQGVFESYNFGAFDHVYRGVRDFINLHKEEKLSFEQTGYFIFFLNKVILTGFENMTSTDGIIFDDLLGIINAFTSISIDFYQAKDEKDEIKKKKIIETGIKTYNTILQKLKSKIRANYFEEERTEKNLLIKKQEVHIENAKILILSKNIKDIYLFFRRNESILEASPINTITKEQFESSKNILDSYFQALTDYSKYELNNNDIYKNLKGDGEGILGKKLRIVDAKKYLAQFNYIDLSNASIDTKSSDYCYNPKGEDINQTDDTFCFEIKNLEIAGGKVIDILLFPSLGNKIYTEIEVGGEMKEVSYILDNLKVKYENNSHRVEIEGDDVEKYKFANFFLYTFNPPQYLEDKDVYVNTENEENKESEIIIGLKRGSLLGKNGTFSVISDYVEVNYDNIIVTETQDAIEIQVKDALINYAIESKAFFGILNSEYIFKKGAISSFKNPEILIIDNNGIASLNNNSIQLFGVFPLEDFEVIIEKIFTNIENITTIVHTISQTTSEPQIDISYDTNLNTFSFKTNSVDIRIQGKILEKIIINGKNVLTKPDKIDNLETYFSIKNR